MEVEETKGRLCKQGGLWPFPKDFSSPDTGNPDAGQMILCGHQKWCYNKLECQRSGQQRPPVTFVIRPTSLPLFNHPGQWGPLGPHQGTLYVSLLAYKRRSVPKYPGRKRLSVHVPPMLATMTDHLLTDNDRPHSLGTLLHPSGIFPRQLSNVGDHTGW